MITLMRQDDGGVETLLPYERLALAVLMQAVLSARYIAPGVGEVTEEIFEYVKDRVKDRDQAQEWITSPASDALCQALDIDFTVLQTWAYAGFTQEQDTDPSDYNLNAYKRSAQTRKDFERG